MSTKVQTHLDFDKKAQIINIKLHSVSSDPSPWAGGLIYNSTEDVVKWSDGQNWYAINDMSGVLTEINQGAGITVSGTGNSRTITFRPDNETLENNGDDKAAVKEKGIDTKELADEAVTYVKIKKNTIQFNRIKQIPSMTVMGYTSGTGDGDVEGVSVIENITDALALHENIASAKAIKDYVDGLVGGLGNLVDGWDADANDEFPVAPNGTLKGDYWYITAHGDIHGISFIEGDVIIAKQDDALTDNPSHWIPLKTKRGLADQENLGIVRFATDLEASEMSERDAALTPANLDVLRAENEDAAGSAHDKFVTPQGLHNRTATEDRRGIAEIATQDEVNDGEDDQRIVTPAKLHVYLNEQMQGYGRFVSEPIGGNTQIDVQHGLDDEFVQVEVIEKTSKKSIICDISRIADNTVRLGFASAPESESLIAIIHK